ncbi:hypothetical protein VaNZ11_010606 [Volvox africanus]|uniref:Uncharacterized protein n=1 Tax=Volvox africanus TaxID=51714 RepID=A0ABQ5S9R0_9CHLO|nr:hypothetical protein VaNZ11_010606 [Volvox africanus]
MEDAFLCAKHAVMLLQAKLVKLHAKGGAGGLSHASKQHIHRTVSAYLSQLQLIHTAVREFLLQLATDPNAGTAVMKLLQCLKSLAEEVPGLEALEEGRPADLAAQVRQLRAAKLEDEIIAMRAAVAALPSDLPVNTNTLEAVVRSLSHQEQSLDFHVKLAAEVSERFGHDAAYSVENFSYGSTPYSSWLQVIAAAGPALGEAMRSSIEGREYVVWGSSCGWLVLYGALTYGWRSRGVELLSCLHSCAERVVTEQGAALPGVKGVRFTCGNLLQDDVSNAWLVVLADQCWDEHLAAAARAKLARELPAGALCVSYSGVGFWGMSKQAVAAAGGASGGDCGDAWKAKVAVSSSSSSVAEDAMVFEELVTLRVRVSWSDAQTFRVFRKL